MGAAHATSTSHVLSGRRRSLAPTRGQKLSGLFPRSGLGCCCEKGLTRAICPYALIEVRIEKKSNTPFERSKQKVFEFWLVGFVYLGYVL